MKKESQKITEMKHHARRLSIKEGILSTVQTSLGNNYVSPFAIAVNMSNSLVALMGSVGGLLGPLTQLFSSRLMEKYSRKDIILRAVLLEVLMWIPFILIGFLFFKGIALALLPLLLIIAFGIQVMIHNIAAPAWFSWMGDIVDDEYRGRWFAKRNLIIGLISAIIAVAASFLLDYLKRIDLVIIGFIILFALSMIGRSMAWRCVKKQYEPKMKLKKKDYFSFWEFLMRAPHTNFGKFSIFRFFLAFSVALISPLIAVYLLRILGLNYVNYTVIIIAETFFSLLAMRLWGELADRIGNYKVMIISSALIPIVPILWVAYSSPLYLILVPSFIGGISWAGFNLSSGNFIYDNVSQEKRGIAVSYYNLLMGIGVFLGAGLGAILIQYLDTTFVHPIVIIFFLSGIFRIITIAIGLPKLKEAKKKKSFRGFSSFKHWILKGIRPTLTEEMHQIRSIKSYISEK